MLEEALNQARIDLRLHLARTADEKGVVLPHAGPAIVEDNRNLLVHLWIRGHCVERLHDIARKTEFQPLRDFIGPIISLPRIERHPL